MIKCHASYSILAQITTNAFRNTHVEPNKVYKGGNEANRSNASHDRYVAEGVLIEFET